MNRFPKSVVLVFRSAGDANLTFSALLADHREGGWWLQKFSAGLLINALICFPFSSLFSGLGHVGRLVATTFETIDILREWLGCQWHGHVLMI